MTKSELQTGMIVKLRNGNCFLVLLNYKGNKDILAGMDRCCDITDVWINLDSYQEDLTHGIIEKYDIMEIYNTRPFAVNMLHQRIWKREDEVKEVTMQEVEEKFGCKVKIINNEQP